MEHRITDPDRVSRKQLEEILALGVHPTIQFSKPGYSRRTLKAVNDYCAEYGNELEVRLYGHYSDGFDASVLKHVPDVQWLSIDCLLRVSNEETIACLPKLRKLSFGVYHFDRPEFLRALNLSQLTRLALTETGKKNFDLAPLERCESLDELLLSGHSKNIAAISSLPKLRTLSLGSIAKRRTLEFVNRIPRLDKLTIVLGGRENIDEVKHSGLSDLEILRVKGLNTLGDLGRFPALRRLLVEDQLQLASISFKGTDLAEISVHNCKTLESLSGLLDLQNLRAFRISRTKLDFDALLNADWPDSMETVDLCSGSQKWNERARRLLGEKGYSARLRRS